MILGSKEFWNHVEGIMALDWSGMDLILYGGIVSGWETKDLDAVIFGDKQKALDLIPQMMKLARWDVYWTTDERARAWHPTNEPITLTIARYRYEGQIEIPTEKQQRRLGLGIEYGHNIPVIQNGQQIYF